MGGTVYINDEKLQISRGCVRDVEVRNIFGFNTAIGTEYIPAWENSAAYVYPTEELQMTAISDNAADTAVTILINGLDINYAIKKVTITLNGTTPVNVGTFFRINDLITLSGNAIGNVTVANNGITYAKITAGAGKNEASLFTVPAGYEFYLYRIDAFSATATLNNRYLFFRNFTRQPNGTILRIAETTFLEQMNIQRRIPFRYAEKTDIQLQLKSSAGTQEIGIFSEGVLVKVPRTSVIG
jgi:hypothetical protein